MAKSLAILLTILVAQLHAQSTPIQTKAYVIGPKDVLQLSMSDLFLASSSGDYKFTTNDTKIKISNTYDHAKDRDLDLSFITKINAVVKVSYTAVAYLYDSNKIAYFDTDNSTASALSGYRKVEGFSGDAKCYDAVYVESMDSMVVLCDDKDSAKEEGKPWTVALFSIDYKSGNLSEISKKIVTMNGKNKVQQSLRIKLQVSNSVDKKSYLAVYNQGSASDSKLDNTYVAFCTGLDSESIDKLTCEYGYDFKKSIESLTSILDIYTSKSRLIVTGLQDKDTPLIAFQCQPSNKVDEVKCSPVNTFDIKTGFVGLLSMDRYYYIDNDKQSLTVCPEIAKWGQKCSSWPFKIDASSFIRDAEIYSGIFLASLQSKTELQYWSYAMIDTATGRTIESRPKTSALIYPGNVLFFRDETRPDKVSKSFVEDNYVIFDAKELAPSKIEFGKQLSIQIDAKNKDDDSIQFGLIVTVQETYIGKPKFHEGIDYPNIDLGSLSEENWPILPKHLSGNGISVSMNHHGSSELRMADTVYHTNAATVTLSTSNTTDDAAKDLIDFKLGDGYLVGTSNDGHLVMYNCWLQNELSVNCELAHKLELESQSNPKLIAAGKFSDAYFFAVVVSGDSSNLYYVSPQKQESLKIPSIVKVASSFIHKVNRDKEEYSATVALIAEDKVIFYGSDFASSNLEKWSYEISKDSIETGVFCPEKLHTTGEGEIYIASTCRSDSRIYVFSLSNLRLPIDDRPINDEYDITNICMFDHRVLVGGTRRITKKSEFYLTESIYNFEAKEEFGHREYGAGLLVDIQCLNNAGLFVISYANEKEKGYIYDIYYSGSSSGRANKRLHSRFEHSKRNLEIHALKDRVFLLSKTKSGSIEGMVSLENGPIIKTTVKPKSLEGSPAEERSQILKGETTILLSDIQAQVAKITLNNQVTIQDSKIQLLRKKVPTADSKIVDLEESLDVIGPVQTTTLIGTSNSMVKLVPRFKTVSRHTSSDKAVGQYEFITFTGGLTVAARHSITSAVPQLLVDIFTADDQLDYSLVVPLNGSISSFSALQKPDSLVLFYVQQNSFKRYTNVLMKAIVKEKSITSRLMLVEDDITKITPMIDDSHTLVFVTTATDELLVISISDTSYERVAELGNVSDFSVYQKKSQFYVLSIDKYGVLYRQHRLIIKKGTSGVLELIKEYKPSKGLGLKSIACFSQNDNSLLCLSNTAGAYIMEFSLDLETNDTKEFYQFKFENYEPSTLVVLDEFIIAASKRNVDEGKNYQLQAWKLNRVGGKGQIIDSYLLTAKQEPRLPFTFNLPLAIKSQGLGPLNANLVTGYAGSSATLLFIRTGSLLLDILNKNFDGENIKLSFTGIETSTMSLQHLFNSKETPRRGSFMWIFWTIFIALIVALIVVIGFIIRFFIKRRQVNIYDHNESVTSYSKAGETYSVNQMQSHSVTLKPLPEDEFIPA